MNTNPSSRTYGAGALGLALFLWGAVAGAHHSISGKFDTKAAKVDLSGVITSVDWRNPHAHVFMNVTTRGETLNWAVELESPSILEMDGWSRDTLRPGEAIVVKGPRARDGSRQIWGEEVRYASNQLPVFAPKVKLSHAPGVPRPTPTWPDGHPALGALPGTSDGFWADPSKTALVEDGVNVVMDP